MTTYQTAAAMTTYQTAAAAMTTYQTTYETTAATLTSSTEQEWIENVTLWDAEDATDFSALNSSVPSSSCVETGPGGAENAAVDTILSMADYKTIERVVECGLMPVVSFLGIPANIINIVVFVRQGLRDKMNLCLFSLATADLLYVLSMFVSTWYCIPAAIGDVLVEAKVKWHVRKWVINFVYAFWYSSGTLTAIIATERCICVTFPLKTARILTTRTMGAIILAAVIIINCLCMNYALKHFVGTVPIGDGTQIAVLMDSDMFNDNKVFFNVINDFILPGLEFANFFVVSLVTIITVKNLKAAVNWRHTTTGLGEQQQQEQPTAHMRADKRQMALVKMLVTVSCIFIVFNAPKLSLAAFRYMDCEFSTTGKYKNLFFATHRAGHVLLMMCNSVNIFVYSRQSSRFRRELRMLGFICASKGSNYNSASSKPADAKMVSFIYDGMITER